MGDAECNKNLQGRHSIIIRTVAALCSYRSHWVSHTAIAALIEMPKAHPTRHAPACTVLSPSSSKMHIMDNTQGKLLGFAYRKIGARNKYFPIIVKYFL